jgi:hypothetical protein
MRRGHAGRHAHREVPPAREAIAAAAVRERVPVTAT